MLLKDFNAWQCMNKRNPKLRSDIYFKLAHYIYVSSTDGLIITIQALLNSQETSDPEFEERSDCGQASESTTFIQLDRVYKFDQTAKEKVAQSM